MTLLSANLNKVALLRNTRTIGIPSVVHAARIALDAGAQGITVHPGADRIELYTEPYALAFGTSEQEKVLGRYAEAARAAQRSGLGVNAGHDLNLDNLPAFLRSVPKVLEVSIGHALISDALELGLAEAVRRYLEAIRRGDAGQGKRTS